MKKYHVCYMLNNEICTGINILAENYIHAIVEFMDKHTDKKIIYVTELLGA
jgi:hypothetical protein